MSKRKRVDPLPDEFSSYEEAAEFWGEHDTADYPEAFAPEEDVVEAELPVRKTLEERRERPASEVPHGDRKGEVMRYLEQEVWPKIPRELLGRSLTKEEQEEILG
jgi:hypothetical protein